MSKLEKNIMIPKDFFNKNWALITITGSKFILTINDKIFSSKLNDSEFKIEPLNKKVNKETSIMLLINLVKEFKKRKIFGDERQKILNSNRF